VNDLDPAALLTVRHLVKEYRRRSTPFGPVRVLRAVDDVSFDVRAGEIFGLAGESGSGKTTTARCLLRLVEPTSGEVRFKERDVLRLKRRDLRQLRRDMQMVFQDPWSSLNPRRRVGVSVEEPLLIHRVGDKASRGARVEELFRLVGLNPAHIVRYPHELSGGQRQRVGVARAIALNPSLVIADEPVSSLDASVQSQIVELLVELQERLQLTYLLIAHDLRLVQRVCARVAIMYGGQIVEMGTTQQIFEEPAHPYTRTLLAAAGYGLHVRTPEA
jgi:ABC-type oligopeptide transport system ATPase subunit